MLNVLWKNDYLNNAIYMTLINNTKREYANNNIMILDRRIWNRWVMWEIENSMGLLSLGFYGMMMRFCAQQMWRANLV